MQIIEAPEGHFYNVEKWPIEVKTKDDLDSLRESIKPSPSLGFNRPAPSTVKRTLQFCSYGYPWQVFTEGWSTLSPEIALSRYGPGRARIVDHSLPVAFSMPEWSHPHLQYKAHVNGESGTPLKRAFKRIKFKDAPDGGVFIGSCKETHVHVEIENIGYFGGWRPAVFIDDCDGITISGDVNGCTGPGVRWDRSRRIEFVDFRTRNVCNLPLEDYGNYGSGREQWCTDVSFINCHLESELHALYLDEGMSNVKVIDTTLVSKGIAFVLGGGSNIFVDSSCRLDGSMADLYIDAGEDSWRGKERDVWETAIPRNNDYFRPPRIPYNVRIECEVKTAIIKDREKLNLKAMGLI